MCIKIHNNSQANHQKLTKIILEEPACLQDITRTYLFKYTLQCKQNPSNVSEKIVGMLFLQKCKNIIIELFK